MTEKTHSELVEEMVDTLWAAIMSYKGSGITFCEAIGIVEMIKTELVVTAMEEGKEEGEQAS